MVDSVGKIKASDWEGLAKKQNPLGRHISQLNAYSYPVLHLLQGGRCAICGEDSPKMRLAIDHDHKTGRIRGLLCRHCNLGLGAFLDDTEVMGRAIDYLNEAGKRENATDPLSDQDWPTAIRLLGHVNAKKCSLAYDI